MTTYTTVSGDTWDQISFKIYGSEKYADKLVKANLDHVYTVVFSSNIVLNVPVIQIEMSSSLPPWKRGDNDVST